MTSELAAVQLFVQGAVRRETPLTEDAGLATQVNRLVGDNARMSPAEQLDVYREQFFLRHVASLEEDFPVASYLLRDNSGFFALARRYLAAHPPKSYDLYELGRQLPAFVATAAPYAEDALLVDAVRFDWSFMEVFNSPEAPPLRTEAIATAPEDAWARAKLVLQPSVRLLQVRYPLDEFRRSVRTGESPARPSPASQEVALFRGADLIAYSMVLEPMAFELLVALAAGEELGAACEQVAKVHGILDPSELGPKVGGWFQQWTGNGWVTEVRF